MTNPDVRSAVPAAARVPAVDHFLAAVAQECADLAPVDRHRLLDGLAEHLAELSADGVDVVAELGDPAAYAAELRATAGMPPAPPRPGAAPTGTVPPTAPHPAPPRRGVPLWVWVLAALTVAGAAVAAVLLLGLLFFSGTSGSVQVATPAPPQPSFRASQSPAVMVPDVTGMPSSAAGEVLTMVGLDVTTRTEDGSPPDVADRVLSQEPVAGSSVAPGTTVTIVVGG
jgi:hypothetical protein